MNAPSHTTAGVTRQGQIPNGATGTDWLHFDIVLGFGEVLLPVVHDASAKPTPGSRIAAFGKIPSVSSRTYGRVNNRLLDLTLNDLRHWSPMLDIKIILLTVVTVFRDDKAH